jgi:hypothetical protein
VKSYLLLTSLLVLMCLGAADSPTSQPTSQPADLHITDIDLAKFYHESIERGGRGDDTFKGKTLRFVGNIHHVATDDSSEYYLEFIDGFYMCIFDDKEPLLHLRVGQTVQLTGECRGRINGVVFFKHCSVEPLN